MNETKIKNFNIIENNKNSIIELHKEIDLLETELANLVESKANLFIEWNTNNYEFLLSYKIQLEEFIEDYKSKAEMNNTSKNLYSENIFNLNEEVRRF